MAMVINSNIQSLNAQRHLNNSLDAQNTATERLSSGLRINSAKDDAAGLAIANRMTSQVQGLDQAIRNANDGAALIQTAEGGLEEMTNIMQRMRELSIQSANGTYDTGNRTTLNAEVDQLKQEIDRIAETTSFNGLNILDGSLGQVDLQVGESANQTIAVNIDNLKSNNLGADGGDYIGTKMTAALSTNLLLVTGTALKVNGDVVSAITAALAPTAKDMMELLSDSIAGVEVKAFVEIDEGAPTSGGNGALSGTDRLILTVAMQDGSTNRVFNFKDTTDMQDLVDKINDQGGDTVSASLGDEGNLIITSDTASSITATGAANGLANSGLTSTTVQHAQLSFTATDPDIENISIEGTNAALLALGLNNVSSSGTITGSTVGNAAILNADELILNGVSISASTAASTAANILAINRHSSETGVTAAVGTTANFYALTSTDGSQIKIEAGDSLAGATETIREVALTTKLGFKVTNDAETASSTVSNIDISSAAGAQKAIGVLDDAIQQVSEERGNLGAISNRLDYTTRNLANISENASSAKSAIMDADFAAESANLSRAQVLQQAGNAMLAQANARPQQVLSLLQ